MSKTLKTIFIVLVVMVVALGSFAGGFVTGNILPAANIPGLTTSGRDVPPLTATEQQSSTPAELESTFAPDRKSVVEGKSVDLGGGRSMKKKKTYCRARS